MMHFDYQARLTKLAALESVDAIALVPGANLTYFTGLHFHLSERPTVALHTADGLSFIVPELELSRITSVDALKHTRTFVWDDEAGFMGAFQQAVTALGLGNLRFGVDGQTMRVFEYLAFQQAGAALPIDVGHALLGIRAIKAEAEVAAVREAIQRSERALAALMAWVKPGHTEREIAAQLADLLKAEGTDEQSFGALVQTGPNSALPHGNASDRPLQADEFLLIDFGGKKHGYPADITRTFCIGTPNAEMQRIYDTVLAANRAAIASIKPGVSCAAVDKAARDVITEAGYGEYFIHRTGHGLGVEVHELPQIAAGVDAVLQAGMLFTVEPGVYVPGLGGVRVEDNVFVTPDGVEVLTSYPRALMGD